MNTDETEHIKTAIKAIVSDIAPDIRFIPKYGGEVLAPDPDSDKIFVAGFFAYRDHVMMEFSEGASFDDPDGLLQGSGKKRKHLKFESADDVESDVIKGFLKQALDQ